LLSNRVLFRSGEGAESSLYQRTKSPVHLNLHWLYPAFLYGQIFEVIPYAVALFTILVVRLDVQSEFLQSSHVIATKIGVGAVIMPPVWHDIRLQACITLYTSRISINSQPVPSELT